MEDFYIIKRKDSLINYSHRVEEKSTLRKKEKKKKFAEIYEELLKHKMICYL